MTRKSLLLEHTALFASSTMVWHAFLPLTFNNSISPFLFPWIPIHQDYTIGLVPPKHILIVHPLPYDRPVHDNQITKKSC